MITKLQKCLLWLFGAMFLVPEILFSFIPLSIANNFLGLNINPLIYSFVDPRFFIDYPIFLLVSMLIEWLGILGLLVFSVKYKKPLFYILLAIILLWLSFVLCVSYIFSKMSLVM